MGADEYVDELNQPSRRYVAVNHVAGHAAKADELLGGKGIPRIRMTGKLGMLLALASVVGLICQPAVAGASASTAATWGPARSAKSCSQLGWDFYSGNTAVCGRSSLPDEGCFNEHVYTYADATSACETVGGRVCTLAEVKGNAVEASGCLLDTSLIWTSTPCQSGQQGGSGHYVEFGDGSATDLRCRWDKKAIFSIRCCGDVATTSSTSTAAGPTTSTKTTISTTTTRTAFDKDYVPLLPYPGSGSGSGNTSGSAPTSDEGGVFNGDSPQFRIFDTPEDGAVCNDASSEDECVFYRGMKVGKCRWKEVHTLCFDSEQTTTTPPITSVEDFWPICLQAVKRSNPNRASQHFCTNKEPYNIYCKWMEADVLTNSDFFNCVPKNYESTTTTTSITSTTSTTTIPDDEGPCPPDTNEQCEQYGAFGFCSTDSSFYPYMMVRMRCASFNSTHLFSPCVVLYLSLSPIPPLLSFAVFSF